jgi:hypothetical protein
VILPAVGAGASQVHHSMQLRSRGVRPGLQEGEHENSAEEDDPEAVAEGNIFSRQVCVG